MFKELLKDLRERFPDFSEDDIRKMHDTILLRVKEGTMGDAMKGFLASLEERDV